MCFFSGSIKLPVPCPAPCPADRWTQALVQRNANVKSEQWQVTKKLLSLAAAWWQVGCSQFVCTVPKIQLKISEVLERKFQLLWFYSNLCTAMIWTPQIKAEELCLNTTLSQTQYSNNHRGCGERKQNTKTYALNSKDSQVQHHPVQDIVIN